MFGQHQLDHYAKRARQALDQCLSSQRTAPDQLSGARPEA